MYWAQIQICLHTHTARYSNSRLPVNVATNTAPPTNTFSCFFGIASDSKDPTDGACLILRSSHPSHCVAGYSHLSCAEQTRGGEGCQVQISCKDCLLLNPKSIAVAESAACVLCLRNSSPVPSSTSIAFGLAVQVLLAALRLVALPDGLTALCGCRASKAILGSYAFPLERK